jgi:hypothetical protein
MTAYKIDAFIKGETHKVELEIDWYKIAVELGAKCLKNKSGKSRLAIGIRARVKKPRTKK